MNGSNSKENTSMCDYSLEMYRSRPARAGEKLTTHRFPSGSIGLTDPNNRDCAVCMTEGSTIQFSNLPIHMRQRLDVGTAKATFAYLEGGPHHDGVILENGEKYTLQQVGPNVEITFIDVAAKVMSDALADPAKFGTDDTGSGGARTSPRETVTAGGH